MPAVARKSTPESPRNYHAPNTERASTRTRTSPVRRWHESPPKSAGARARSTPAPAQGDETADLRGLLDHFTGENAARTHQQQKEVEARRVARKRARLSHRPFRMTVLAGAMLGAPLALLACLLWINSNSLAFSREDSDLQKKIAATRSESERTREEIAAVNASPQVEEWARARGWRIATQNDFDDISKPAQVNPQNVGGPSGESEAP